MVSLKGNKSTAPNQETKQIQKYRTINKYWLQVSLLISLNFLISSLFLLFYRHLDVFLSMRCFQDRASIVNLGSVELFTVCDGHGEVQLSRDPQTAERAFELSFLFVWLRRSACRACALNVCKTPVCAFLWAIDLIIVTPNEAVIQIVVCLIYASSDLVIGVQTMFLPCSTMRILSLRSLAKPEGGSWCCGALQRGDLPTENICRKLCRKLSNVKHVNFG